MPRLIAALILLVLLFILILQNLQQVSLHFLFWQFNGSLALMLLLTFIVSVIIILLLVLPKSIMRWIKQLKTKETKLKETSKGDHESKSTI